MVILVCDKLVCLSLAACFSASRGVEMMSCVPVAEV